MTRPNASNGSPPLSSIDDLVRHFARGEKSRERFKIGTEHEKMIFLRKTRLPVPYEGRQGIGMVLEAFRTKFGWEPVLEGENLIALTRGEASITLEPGGQLELSGATLDSSHDTCREMGTHLRETREITEELDLLMLNVGRNPSIPSGRMPWMPKERYRIMRNYLPTRGGMALDMMLGTGTMQTNIDYSDEEDMDRKLRVANRLAPFLIALYANSPFAEGRPTGFLSTRSLVWRHTDPDRSGFIPGVLGDRFGYRDYMEYALDVPMFFIHRDGRYLDHAGGSFRKFMTDGLEGHRATEEDWELHLTTLFPLVRLKQYLELRMADSGPQNMVCAFAAFTRGAFYDPAALSGMERLLREIPAADFPSLELRAARDGLRAEALGRPFTAWAQDILTLAKGGLERLDATDAKGENEAKLLAPLEEIAAGGKTLADRLLDLWEGEWNRGIEPIFESPLTVY
ncbi:MAG: glutamate--cysteine ligase [bacterium]